MAAVVPQIGRHLSRCQAATAAGLRSPQRRWARVHDVRFLATHQQSNERVTDRYKAKLQQKVREKGLGDISELKDAYKEEISKLRKEAAVPGATAPLDLSQAAAASKPSSGSPASPWPKPPPPPRPQPLDPLTTTTTNSATPTGSRDSKPPGVKTLSSFLDIPKILELPPREIEGLWRLRHAGRKGSLCASIPAHTYESIVKTAQTHPQFVLPGLPQVVPAADEEGGSDSSEHAKPAQMEGGGEEEEGGEGQHGAVIHFLQWTFPTPDTATVMFTHLAEYKLRGEFAQPHTTLTHHLELAGPKGLVLCQGDVVEGRGVSVEEARWLVMCLQKFYNTTNMQELEQSPTAGPMDKELNKRRRRLMEQFSCGDATFSLQALLEETERLG